MSDGEPTSAPDGAEPASDGGAEPVADGGADLAADGGADLASDGGGEPASDGGGELVADGGAPVEDVESKLEYPESDWAGFFREHFGPSMLWALIGIGGSHIVLAPTLGGTFGLFAIWVFALIYAAKYGGWELGIRYNYGAGGNPIEAYDQLPGPKNWGLWVTVGIFTIAYTGLVTAVGTSTSAFFAAVTGLSLPNSFAILIGASALFVAVSRYGIIEKVLTVFTVSIGLLLVVGVILGPPSGDIVSETLLGLPGGMGFTDPAFVGLVAAAAGFAPTGFSTSILIGSWSMAKEQGARQLRQLDLDPEDPEYHDYIEEWIATGKRDFNIGYAFSFVIIASMVILAANILYPDPPTDQNLAIAVSRILSESLGAWSRWAVIAGAFAALYSTVITLMDGSSRATSEILPMALETDDFPQEKFRKGMVAVQGLIAIAIVVGVGPGAVSAVVWIAATLAVVEIFFYPANWYVVEKNLPEKFTPSRAWHVFYVVSLVFVVVFGIMGAATQLGYI